MSNARSVLGVVCAASIAALGASSCAGSSTAAAGGAAIPPAASSSGGGSSAYIQHVVIVIQENRSFDDLFAKFPGADGTNSGLMKTRSGDKLVVLKKVDLAYPCDFEHVWKAYLKDLDGGKMDGFNSEYGGGKCPGRAGTRVYQYVNPSQIQPYWTMAGQYVLADHMFQTQGSGSFTAHQDLIRGNTAFNARQTKSLIDYPSNTPWGCDSPSGTLTSVLASVSQKLQYEYHEGPFPCLTYSTLRDLLDAKSVSWKYYAPPVMPHGHGGGIWNAFDAIKAVRYGPEWGTNVPNSNTRIFTDIADGALPAVSWVIPDSKNSDHPGHRAGRTGPSWVAGIVNAIGESAYWRSTAIVVVWDDWGGFYDHEPPAFFDHWGGLGFRVPMIVVSAYAREGSSGQGYISHTPYEFGSILEFVEDVWRLGRLGTTDTRATSIVDCFDFTQSPRSFQAIPSGYSRTYFERQAPSYEPVDTQ